MSEIREAVRRGAALLDEREPGWRDRISPGELRMNDCSQCVVGQVAGLANLNFLEDSVEDSYVLRLHEWGIGLEDESVYGFVPVPFHQWDELRDAWIGYLKGHWE